MALIDVQSIEQKEVYKVNDDEKKVIEAFGNLIKEKDKGNKDEIKSIIKSLLEKTDSNERQRIKMFILNMENGLMINSDDAPNVSFRVETVNNIFDSIITSMNDMNIEEEAIKKIFYNAGKKCGKGFGKAHFLDYKKNHTEVTIKGLIEKWCEFDSAVGMGKINYIESENAIIITNNFEAQERHSDGGFSKDCEFFKGYIVGVLCELMQKEVVIDEADSCADCPKKNCFNQRCYFKIKVGE